jgi:hypothetical protein
MERAAGRTPPSPAVTNRAIPSPCPLTLRSSAGNPVFGGVQFCLENVSFILKCVLKPGKIEAEEIAERLVKIAPPLERYLRSSAPTELSTIALKTRKVEQIKHLFDEMLALKFDH